MSRGRDWGLLVFVPWLARYGLLKEAMPEVELSQHWNILLREQKGEEGLLAFYYSQHLLYTCILKTTIQVAAHAASTRKLYLEGSITPLVCTEGCL